MTTQVDTSYTLAPGHSISTLRGMLHEGEAITARDLPGGKAQLDTLVAAKAVAVVQAKPAEADESKAKRGK
jgi:hypothetical protein